MSTNTETEKTQRLKTSTRKFDLIRSTIINDTLTKYVWKILIDVHTVGIFPM